MPGVVATIEVNAAPEALWEILCDASRYAELADPTDRMLSVPDEPMGVGYVYREYGGIPPFKGESEWTVTVFEPFTRQVHVGDDGSVTMNLDVQMEDAGDGRTRYTQRLDLAPRWWLRLPMAVLWPVLLRSKAQTAMDRTVENFKQAVEAEA